MKQSIADFYNDIIRMCKTFAELEETSFEPEEGASEEEIAKCEEILGAALPDDIKDFFRLTKGISIEEIGDFYIVMPTEAFENEDGGKSTCIGNSYLKDYFIDLENGTASSFDDGLGEQKVFDSIEDMFDDMYFGIMRLADDNYPDEWQKVYDELFPDNKIEFGEELCDDDE